MFKINKNKIKDKIFIFTVIIEFKSINKILK